MTRPKNFIETDTETFFRDQNFRDRDRYSQKIEKSLDTEKSRDEMSHSGGHWSSGHWSIGQVVKWSSKRGRVVLGG